MITRIALIFSLAVTNSALTTADEPANTPAASAPIAATPIDAATAKQQALDWLDKYRKEQVLFHQKDLERVRKELADGSDEEGLQWWKESAEIRAALDSPQWKDTQSWLREFLEVQAIFSDQEVDAFRSKAEQEVEKKSSQDFKKILADVEQYRRKLSRSSANSRELRDQQLKVVSAFKQKEAAARAAAAAQAAATVPQSTVTPPFKKRAPRYPTSPLIDSLDAARWSVIRGFWRY